MLVPNVDRCATAAMICLTLAVSGVAQAATCFVKPGAPSGNDGTTWASATALQSALANAGCSELWVMGGHYTPTSTTDRSISFVVRPGTAVYGGFAGTETQRTQRDPRANVTVLSGDIDGNDTGANGIDATTNDIKGNNSYHVVTMSGKTIGQPIDSATVLDGLVITGGAANGSYPNGYGGGLYCDASLVPTAVCSPRLNDVLFSGNFAGFGGAIFNQSIYGGDASPTITNSTFRGNAVYANGTAKGGAIYNEGYGGNSSPVLINVTFSGNSASNSTNDAAGGAMYNSGYDGTSSPALINVTFSGNHAVRGGAMFDDGTVTGNSHPSLTNVILWGNSVDAGGTGPQIDEDSGSAQIAYSIVEGGCPAGSGCGTGVVAADPLLGPLQDNGGATPTFAIAPGSSAVDSGSDAACPATDQRGEPRPQGAHCDIGAYELASLIFADGFEAP